MKKLIIPVILFIAVTLFALWWHSDSLVLKRKTNSLADILTVEPESNKAIRSFKNQELTLILAEKFHADLESDFYSGSITRDDAITGHQYMVQSVNSCSTSMEDFQITSLEDTTAKVSATFNLSIVSRGGSSQSQSTHALLSWRKNDSGNWELFSTTLSPRL